MTPRLRKFVLTTHVTFSVGWLGAVVGFLALAIAGLASREDQTVRSAYIAMGLIGWFVIVPFSVVSFASGLVQSLGTEWGLFRHYWILVKLFLNTGASILLLVHMQPTSRVARAAAVATLSAGDLPGLRVQLVADAGAAVLVLIVATVLSIYKPWGLTAYGRRVQRERAGALAAPQEFVTTTTPWGRYVVGGIVGLIIVFIVVHLAGGGLHGHG